MVQLKRENDYRRRLLPKNEEIVQQSIDGNLELVTI